jgi:hypothetical protein
MQHGRASILASIFAEFEGASLVGDQETERLAEESVGDKQTGKA